MILKKDSGDEHKFCTTLMEKTVGRIGILNSDLFSDQFFLQCTYEIQKRNISSIQENISSIQNYQGLSFLRSLLLVWQMCSLNWDLDIDSFVGPLCI
jgi:hypothetical protein